MSDIVEHLRHMYTEHDWRSFEDAANEIERLRSQLAEKNVLIAELRAELQRLNQIANYK